MKKDGTPAVMGLPIPHGLGEDNYNYYTLKNTMRNMLFTL